MSCLLMIIKLGLLSIIQKRYVVLCQNKNVIYYGTEKIFFFLGNSKHFTNVFSFVITISPR